TISKEVQNFNTYQKINDAIEKIIKLEIFCSSQQHQSSLSQDSQDRIFSDLAIMQCIEEIEATFLLPRQEDNHQNQEGQEVVEEEEKEEEQVEEQQQEEEEQYKGENEGKVEHQQQQEEPAIFDEPMMDAFVDAPFSDVVEAVKELAEAQTSVTDAKESDDDDAEIEELVEAQKSITDGKESDDATTRAKGVKDGKTPEVIVLINSSKIDVGKEDTETCPNQVKLEGKHADVVDDVKDEKSDEKKGVVEESKSSGSSSKKLPISKTNSERTASDQATSTKKSRCPGDFTPPSFDLGIDAAFDYVEVVISTTDKETSCESVQQIVQEIKASKTEERQVDLNVKAIDMEKKLFSWIIDSANDEKEKVFQCEGYHCDGKVFQSLDVNAYVSDNVISVWARLLNHNEIIKAVESPLRFFCRILPLVSVNFF
ncbi:hypothetical protein V2J09_022679, partial [Rumex salicifolius]